MQSRFITFPWAALEVCNSCQDQSWEPYVPVLTAFWDKMANHYVTWNNHVHNQFPELGIGMDGDIALGRHLT